MSGPMNTTKICRRCNSAKSLKDFGRHKNYADGLNSSCKECMREYHRIYRENNLERRQQASRKYYDANKEKVLESSTAHYKKYKEEIAVRKTKYYLENKDNIRDYKLKLTYGISLEHYNTLLEQQGGVCAICSGISTDGKALAVDHDHSCCPGKKACGKCIRGLLCNMCNLGIGFMREDIDILNKSVAYVQDRRVASHIAQTPATM